jgi:4-amino-4-deoxy-L-arabinose transferase-like glycosyltransferase
VVRATTVSNTQLEVLMATALLYVLWCAHEDRDERRLVLAGVLMGLALLTKLTLVALAPLLVVVAARHALRGRKRRAWLAAGLMIVLPLILLTPWFIFNLHHYDALTASELAKQLQEPLVNPGHVTYTLGRTLDLLPHLFEGVLPQDWAAVVANAPLMALAFDFIRVAVFGLPVLLLLVEPRWLRSRHALLLAAPFLLGIAMVGYVTLVENWPIGNSRRLYAELPALALFTGWSCLRLFRSSRVAPALAATSSGVLTAAWVDLTSRFLL